MTIQSATNDYDVLILGAGGAGMMCAIHAARRYRRVAVIDHSSKIGGKIIISGGGRCNFTNLAATYRNYVSNNEHFCKSALSRFQPEEFLEMVRDHEIPYHERKHRQLFCDRSARDLIQMLQKECDQAGVSFLLSHQIQAVRTIDDSPFRFSVETNHGKFRAESLVVATGGLSIPKMGATGFGYDLAKQLGLKVTALAPALDGFVFKEADRDLLSGFSGVAFDVIMTCKSVSFRENLLFTHAGLSGPVSLQVSLHWQSGDPVSINFIPSLTAAEFYTWLTDRKASRAEIKNLMTELVPKRLAERFYELYWPITSSGEPVSLPHLTRKDLEAFCDRFQAWTFVPASTVGYGKAEVTRGGVDTDELSSKTMEAKKVPGLYFVGEVVDVTGWLGGFNYQWAWASGRAAGEVC